MSFAQVKSYSSSSFLLKLGNNIRRIRKIKGLSMEGLSNEIEMEYRQLGRIERGEINTTILSLLKISVALKVTVKDLLDFD
ncbi:MAG: helix-turn-helix domain-containing protein [Sphingobacteriales bacterium]